MRSFSPLRSLLALAFANGVADASLIPLLPSIRADLGLTALQAGAMLSATTLAMLATALPVGLLAGRLGVGRLLLVASALIPVSLAVLALADGLALVLVARVLFGVSFGIVWVVGPARAMGEGRGAAGTGRLVAVSGAGWLVGPVLAGAVADLAGWRVAFAVLAVLCLPLAALFAFDRSGSSDVRPVRLRDALRAARRDRSAGGATLASGLLGVVTGVTGLLAPLVLAANGLSAGAIGLAVGVSAGVWAVAAALVGRLESRRVNVHALGIGAAVLAAAWVLPVVSLSTAVVVGFLVVSAACRSSIGTLVYAVGARGAGSEGAAAAVIGVMNIAWAVAALAAPLVAGAVDGEAGIRLAFAATALLALALAAWILVPRRVATATA